MFESIEVEPEKRHFVSGTLILGCDLQCSTPRLRPLKLISDWPFRDGHILTGMKKDLALGYRTSVQLKEYQLLLCAF